MNNLSLIKRLKQIKDTASSPTITMLDSLINDLKQEIINKSYKGSEAERHKVSLSFQKMMFKKPRPVLALWHKNTTDNKYYFTNSAILVRVSEEDFFKDLRTTAEKFTLFDRNGFAYYSWGGDVSAYPNFNQCWVDGKPHEEVNVNMPAFMAWLKANSNEQYGTLNIKDKTLIRFDISLIKSALIMSKVAQEKGDVVLKYIGDMNVFQFGDNCLCTPIRYYGSDKAIVFEVK